MRLPQTVLHASAIRLSATVFIAVALSATVSRAYAATTDVGATALVLGGTHIRDGGVTYRGVIPGALLRVDRQIGRAGIHVETLPFPVSVHAGGAGAYGRTSVGLSVYNADVTYDVLPGGGVRVGLGTQLVNLTNFDGGDGRREAARESGVTYVLGGTLPLGSPRQGVDIRLAVIPNVRAVLQRVPSGSAATASISERGAESDLSIAYRKQFGRWIYRAGVRLLSYSTRDTATQALVDRNTGAGGTIEAQYRFGRE